MLRFARLVQRYFGMLSLSNVYILVEISNLEFTKLPAKVLQIGRVCTGYALKLRFYMKFDPIADTLFVGRQLEWLSEVASTNEFMASKAASLSEGAVVGAEYQSAGRGQLGAVWLSNVGENITCSFLFRPSWLSIPAQFQLSQAVSLSVSDALATILPKTCNIRVKWPNDVYVDHAKIAGILIQNTLSGAYLSSAVVGIGLNVNQVLFPQMRFSATSLALATGQVFDRQKVLSALCVALEQRYLQLRSRPDLIRVDYLKRLYAMGEISVFRNNASGTTFTGIIRGINVEGQLLIDDGGDDLLAFGLKEITF